MVRHLAIARTQFDLAQMLLQLQPSIMNVEWVFTNVRRYVDLMHYLDCCDLDEPHRHPAASLDIPHPLLEVYDSRIYPDCLERAFSNQPFFDTSIGITLRELNSPLGIPTDDFSILIHSFATCSCCLCTFSRDGYNRHIQGGICSSHPEGATGEYSVLILYLSLSDFFSPSQD